MTAATSEHSIPDIVFLSWLPHSLLIADSSSIENATSCTNIVRDGVVKEISKRVVRQKLNKLRHLVIEQGISPCYLDSLFPEMLKEFDPQHVVYNGGIAKLKEWKISCYLEVMESDVPCTNPNTKLLQLFEPLLDTCNDLFLKWYRQLHASFVQTDHDLYHKHVDGDGKVDGSCVAALPVDRWLAPEEENFFIGHGGGLTFWDGKDPETKGPQEIHYETRSGDLAFIDRAVWHQAEPITTGTRWALVIFYDVQTT